MIHNIVILASNGVQALDVTGPADVFSSANNARSKCQPYMINVVSPDGGLIETASGVKLHSQSIRHIPAKSIDTLLISGHDREGLNALIAKGETRNWVRLATEHAQRWGSVCTGAFALADWGLLKGKRAATHWARAAELAERYPDTDVDSNSIYVVDGYIWTSAGVTAGIDMSLAMVEADLGPDRAAEVARKLVVYLRRPGSQAQFSAPLKHQSAAASPYADLISWVKSDLDQDLTIETLARYTGQSVRTFQRHFTESMGSSPAAFIEELRVERAKGLIAFGVPLKTVTREVGFPAASRLTSAFRRRVGLSPSVWKAMHSKH